MENLGPLLPTLCVLGAAFLVMALDLLPGGDDKAHLGGVALAGIVAALLAAVWRWGANEKAFHGMVVLDGLALFFTIAICYAAALVVLLSLDYLHRTRAESGEYYTLVLLATAGMLLMATAGDLISVFLALELMSLCLYVLAGLFKTRRSGTEASMKYFLLGAFASSFLLYGIALIYGATGSTRLDQILTAVESTAAKGPDTLLLVGLGLTLVGFGFKISAVPFHMWAPDVYEGAPTSVTAFIATGSKAAAFAALIRILDGAVRSAQADWVPILWLMAALTMTLGNVVALAQTNLKRMLAYSSIAHVGYILVGLVAASGRGTGAVLFYVLSYVFTTTGAFGVILLCERAGSEAVELKDFSGLGRRNPLLATVLTLFLLSLIGIPPLAGFFGKFYLFGAAVQSGHIWLVVIGVLNSAVAAYYYLRVIIYMFMRESEDGPAARYAPSFAGALALGIALVGIVLLGVVPAPFVDLAQAAVSPLFR